MTNILLCGANGKMGHATAKICAESEDIRIAAGFDINKAEDGGFPVFDNVSDLENIKGKIDCIVDFSHPSLFDEMLRFAADGRIPYIICTTGLSSAQKEKIKETAKISPVFYSANMSLGINLITELAKAAAKALENNFDIEILEKHHNQKLDAPSGTALTIADAISDSVSFNPEYVYDRHSVRKKRDKNEIGIHSVRGGTIVGEHTVIFAGCDEVIEIKHSAASKEVFAVGAVRAASFMKNKPAAFYTMEDVINE